MNKCGAVAKKGSFYKLITSIKPLFSCVFYVFSSFFSLIIFNIFFDLIRFAKNAILRKYRLKFGVDLLVNKPRLYKKFVIQRKAPILQKPLEDYTSMPFTSQKIFRKIKLIRKHLPPFVNCISRLRTHPGLLEIRIKGYYNLMRIIRAIERFDQVRQLKSAQRVKRLSAERKRRPRFWM